MTERVRFSNQVPPDERQVIALNLSRFADAGYEVGVDFPEDGPQFGWMIRLERPGGYAAFRTAAATSEEWATVVARVLEGLSLPTRRGSSSRTSRD